MGIQDIILGPIVFLILFQIGYIIKNRIKDEQVATYFIWGLNLKLLGALGIAFIYFFYYGSGDTVYYFKRAMTIDRVLFNDVVVGFKLLFANPDNFDPETYYYFQGLRARDMSSFLVVRMAAITNIFCFNSYVANAFLFSALSYVGVWRSYKVFIRIFPKYKKILAIAFLFIPSVFFWGSGVLKDNVTYGFLGILISSFYYIFIVKEKRIKNLFYFMISLYVVGVIKSYVLMALLPGMIFWVFFEYRNKLSSNMAKAALTPILLVIIVGAGFGALQLLSSTFSKFSIDNAQQRAEDMQRWHTYRVEVLKGGDGSSYNLGSVSFTPIGILSKIPAAVSVSLFRPFPWEAGNPVMMLSALESLFFLIITLRLFFIFTRNMGEGFGFMNNNAAIVFMLVFSFIFAFSVGFTSFNFGALSRYRIPLLPYYVGAVLILTKHLKNYSKVV